MLAEEGAADGDEVLFGTSACSEVCMSWTILRSALVQLTWLNFHHVPGSHVDTASLHEDLVRVFC